MAKCHVWEDNPLYPTGNTCRTEHYPKLGEVLVCDYCSTVIKDHKELGREFWYPKTDEYLLIGDWNIEDARPAGLNTIIDRPPNKS